MIASTDFRLTYFDSALGYVWSLMRPLLTFAVMFLVFSRALKLGHSVKDYPVLLLLNIVLITFFQEATGGAVTAVLNREGLVRKMHFPRLVIPIATVLTAAFNAVLNLLAVFVFLLAYGINPRWSWFGLVLLLTGLLIMTAGVAALISSLYVRFRDVGQIWGVVSQVLFYGSLVFFTIERIHGLTLRRIVLMNPIAATLQQARHWVIDPQSLSVSQAMGGGLWWLAPVAIGASVFVLGMWVFNHEAPRIAERL
jgi:ABC-2 type transport system permease protein